MRNAALSTVLVMAFGISAHAALFMDSGPVSQGGTSLSFEESVTGNPYLIDSVELVLTFGSRYDLGGNINGALILDPGGLGANATFTPTISRAGTGGQAIYDVTFTGHAGSFDGYNPNGIWALNLWDTGASGIENGLVSWSLSFSGVTPVPEPVNVALGIFGGVCVLILLARNRSLRVRIRDWWVAANQWIDAV